MKKLLATLAVLMGLVWHPITAQAVSNIYGATCLLGAAACVDGIDVGNADGNGTDLAVGDMCFVVMDAGTNEPELYVYRLYSTSAAEASPNIIMPDYVDAGAYSGALRWYLVKILGTTVQSVPSASAAGAIDFYETSGNGTDYIRLKAGDDQGTTPSLIISGSPANVESLKITLGANDNTVTISSDSGVTSLSFSALNMVTTGTMSGKMPTVVYSADGALNVSLAQARANTFFLNTYAGTLVMTLPAAEAGMAVCLRNGQNNSRILQVHSDGTDFLVPAATGLRNTAANHFAATASPTNQICLVAFDTTDWYVTSTVGTWAEE